MKYITKTISGLFLTLLYIAMIHVLPAHVAASDDASTEVQYEDENIGDNRSDEGIYEENPYLSDDTQIAPNNEEEQVNGIKVFPWAKPDDAPPIENN
ncbi:MAG: hypothetical protein KJ950_13785 [Proteobacteria bacterium]|nr:hypothetical protein [Pseudomonadota bacterium]MBU1686080.1 hypothetical protein [Pseudomonadota bacterium]